MYGLIFDVDGVVADTEAVNAAASIRMFDELFGLTGVVRADFEKGLGRGAAAYVRAAAEVHARDLTEQEVEAATAARQEYFLEHLRTSPLPAFPGVLELMNAARERDDFRLAIATSSTREKSEAVLRSARVPFEELVYVTGSDVRRKKPAPELFQTAASRIGVPPHRCLVIEDAPNGVEAALAAGCVPLAVTNSVPAEALADAASVVASIAEVSIEDVIRLIEARRA